ncbi:DUF2461 domain-containing protein [Dysgonomonas sp. Marseille-P4677]|uniref:DUF2461 domain-containing protein n=1 Tax=Dysgonomonas sp. Marseille-P4677 TaxID=2364790 RepID=UPI0019145137|nr:DUF2461 domain-containing protein [Dysgonomonas sp. Marseille-P4677]MBK5721849.1 DUF2461 domain-containing protein [Dysgonomonas sp. Marseille-P4677]
MLKKDTLDFLKALKANNNREWFAQNKDWYERARKDFEHLVGEVIQAIASIEPEMGTLEPKKCIFRIYRDVRFSPDKSPYKTHFGAVFTPRNLGKSSGYYLHIDPAESFVSCGHYMLMPDQLKKMRQGIYSDFEYFKEILDEKRFKKEIGDLYRDDDMLTRVPNGFYKDHPSAEYMKLKHFYALKPISEDKLLSDGLVPHIKSIYKLMQPLNRFLNDVLLED